MSPVKYGKVFTTVLFMVYLAQSAVIEVAKDLPMNSIQDAVKQAEPNDIIEILDDGVYEEQVTIDSLKDGLTIRGNPNSKPTILWRDTKSIHPTSSEAAQNEDSAKYQEEQGIYFDQNGALRILKAKRVTIENIIVDGEEAFYFRHEKVWVDEGDNKFDLFHGNAAIVLWLAGDAVIKNCELRNAYFGISVKDRNVRGIFADPNPADIMLYNIVPLSGFGKTGNHLFERNRIHGNSWGMFFESTWDLGSTIRYNLFYNNHHQTSKIESDVREKMGEEGANQMGGGILFKDDPISPVAIYNNTFYRNRMCIACTWQSGAYHLVFNNIFGRPNVYNEEWRLQTFSFEMNLMDRRSKDADRYKHNLYASQGREPDPNSFDKIRPGMDDIQGSRPYSEGAKL